MDVFRSHRAALIAALVMLVFMPSNDSLWIDEGATARLASKPTFQAWRAEMVTGHFSEHQMPLSMAFAWLMAKALGTSEWQLRAVNIFWGVLAVLAFYRAGQALAISWLPLVLVLHPFFWYYMNEARPYVMQIACGAWFLYSLVFFISNRGSDDNWAISLATAGIILCGSSLLGVIPFVCVSAVLFWLGLRHRCQVHKSAWRWLVLCAVCLLPVGLFYIWTFTKHAGGARLWPVSYKNVAFAIYELAGFTGLGPGRDTIRWAATQSHELSPTTFAPYLPGLVLLAVAYLCLGFVVWKSWNKNKHKLVAVASFSIVLSTFGATLSLALIVHWPFWGRHFAAVLPFAVVLLGIGFKLALADGSFGRVLVGVFALLFAVSSLEQRFSPVHAKDDYRSAAAAVRDAIQAGRTIWWVADPSTGTYYHVGFDQTHARSIDELAGLDLSQTPPPDLVAYSKRDVYDPSGKIDNYLREHDFKATRVLPAFQIFERQPEGR